MKVVLIVTCHPRIELDFIEEWLKHYTLLGFDRIDIYVDPGYHQGKEGSYKWWKSKHEYHDELTDSEVVQEFKKRVGSFGIQCLEGSPGKGLVKRQVRNLLNTLDNVPNFDYIFHLDIDEFLIMKGLGKFNIKKKLSHFVETFGESNFGFLKTLMSHRWLDDGGNIDSVYKIRETKGCVAGSVKGTPCWKSALNIGKFKFQPEFRRKRGKLIHGFLQPHVTIPIWEATIFHFAGWEEARSRPMWAIKEWRTHQTYKTTEHVVYRNLMRKHND